MLVTLMVTPTTKAKQRDYLDALIHGIATKQLLPSQLLRHLRILRKQLHNRRAARGRLSAPPTHSQRNKILQLHRTTPMSMQEISQKLGVSIGRVSEVIRGKRK